MADIGKEKKIIEVLPVKEPARAPAHEPAQVPAREPEKTPA